MKTREEKNDAIEVLRKEFQQSPNALVMGFQGIKVADDERLRRELRQAKLSYRVIKNTLARRAAEGTPIEQIRDSFTGATAVALSPADPVTLAKLLSKWVKESNVFSFKAGVVEGRRIEVKDIEAISNLPSKEVLVSKMMFMINSGAQRLATVSGAVARNLVVVLDQVRSQKESQGGA
ncbi:MAG TPA: 50S ribosomal protein L10 [Blastocatellia bacterium]|nr:50S ribosomal protein L10 [Blastocatellia bacterium]